MTTSTGARVMADSTPRPWGRSGGGGIVTECGLKETLSSGREVRRRVACAKGATIEEVSANVALIVRAVNAHDGLAWFAEQIFNGLDTGLLKIETPADETLANVLAKGRAALSAARK